MDGDAQSMECPFCGYRPQKEEHADYQMSLHIETNHAEGKSPSALDERLSNPESATADLDGVGDGYVECPIDGCNEIVVRDELDYHLELHGDEAEDDLAATTDASTALPESQTPSIFGGVSAEFVGEEASRTRSAKRRRSSPSRDTSEDSEEAAAHDHRKKAIFAWKNILTMPIPKWNKFKPEEPLAASTASVAVSSKVPKKLGKAELGRFANEKQMPDWLVQMLKNDGQVVGYDIIPVLKQLLQQAETTSYAYLCHPCVQHVSKLRREGGFCGYRNIQMISSYIFGANYVGAQHFNGQLPSIFDIQEHIEDAWDHGINQQGRVETGGVRGTRKYIGTPEAQAMFVHLKIPCEAQGFKNKKEAGRAEASLLVHVERYFQQGIFNPEDKVRHTDLPPIYFQHMGHSMTIVGIEKTTSGQANLLVFDPMFRDAKLVTQRVGRTFAYKHADTAMNAYRRGHKYLRRYREFELLKLVPPKSAVYCD